MKYILIILLAFIIVFPLQVQANKNPRPATVQKEKLKKPKIAKKYRLYEPSKRKKTKFIPYTQKSKRFYKKTSKKINPKYFCNPTKD